jgi:hypothetical protein
MIVIPECRGHRIEVNAIAVDGGYDAEVRLLRLFGRDKLHVETVTCLKLRAEHAERADEIWAQWVDLNAKDGE